MITLQEVSPPNDGVRYTEEDVQLFFDTQKVGNGILYIGERNVVWIENGKSLGIQFSYHALVTHGISNDTTAFPDRCLFLTIDGSKTNFNISSSENEDENDCVYLRMVPSEDSLNIMYQMLSECQELNPEEDDINGYEEPEFDGMNPYTLY
uniref:Methylosome subunit pICln n=1 Tax=Parastrongyloides trichosuri TaxID=131310 RepID=A0A0N4ZJX5_PARTI